MAQHKVRNHNLHTSGAETVTGTGSAEANVEDLIEARLFIDATVVTGSSPSMTIVLQDSPDASEWYDHTTLSAITSAGNTGQNITNFSKYVRIKWTISGTTPSFTFSAVFSGKT